MSRGCGLRSTSPAALPPPPTWALSNTPAVARSSYVDPRLLDRYEHGETVSLRGRAIETELLALLG